MCSASHVHDVEHEILLEGQEPQLNSQAVQFGTGRLIRETSRFHHAVVGSEPQLLTRESA